MRVDAILAPQRKQPFRPMRICVSDGSFYDVWHREWAPVTRTEVVIAMDPGEDDIPDRAVYCDPVHITRIEPVDGTKRQRSGRRSR